MKKIESRLEGGSSTKPFINKYNWEGINYPSQIDDWKMFEKNNATIALHILYTKEKEICPAYISKINSNCEKQITLLGDFCCVNYPYSYRTENKVKCLEKI